MSPIRSTSVKNWNTVAVAQGSNLLIFRFSETSKNWGGKVNFKSTFPKPLVLYRFSKFKKWLIQQNKGHLNLWAYKTMTKFSVAGIDSEKCFDVRKSKFQTSFSEGKADFRCNFEPCSREQAWGVRSKCWPVFGWYDESIVQSSPRVIYPQFGVRGDFSTYSCHLHPYIFII